MPDQVSAPAAAPAAPAATPTAPAKVETKAPAAPAKVETKVETPAVDPAKKEQERHAAALARAKRIEADNRKAAEKLKLDQQAFETERLSLKEATEKAKTHDEWARLASEDPLALLERAGVSKQQILDRMIKGDSRTPEEIAQAVVEKTLRERDAQAKKDQEAAEVKNRADLERQVAETKEITAKYIDSLIQANTEKYEFCANSPNAAQRVWDVIQEYYNETSLAGRPEILPYEEALDTVESSFEAEFESFQGSSKKLAAKKAAAEVAEVEAKKVQETKVAESLAKDDRSKGRFKEFEPRKPKVSPEESSITTDDLFKRRNRSKLIEEINNSIKQSKE